MARVKKEDWLKAGLKQLAQGGYQDLTLEALCAQLQKTRGSFYHHFASMHIYQAALLDAWQAKQTQGVIDAAKANITGLTDLVLAQDLQLERQIRAWAMHEKWVEDKVAEVDQQRLDFLALHRHPPFSKAMALQMARLEYGAFLGSIHLLPYLDLPALRAQGALLIHLIEHEAARHLGEAADPPPCPGDD